MAILSSYPNRTLTKLAGVDTSGNVGFSTQITVATDGSVNVGGAGYATPPDAMFKVQSITGSPWTLAIEQYTNDNGPPTLFWGKSRGTSINSQVLVQNNDIIAALVFRASNGTSFRSAGYIDCFVDGVASPTSMPGRIVFGTEPAGSVAGSIERMRITNAGSVVIGNVLGTALATNATDGFLYVPTCAGTPTGTPTTQTNMAPIVINTTNNKLYFYSTGAWRDAGP